MVGGYRRPTGFEPDGAKIVIQLPTRAIEMLRLDDYSFGLDFARSSRSARLTEFRGDEREWGAVRAACRAVIVRGGMDGGDEVGFSRWDWVKKRHVTLARELISAIDRVTGSPATDQLTPASKRVARAAVSSTRAGFLGLHLPEEEADWPEGTSDAVLAQLVEVEPIITGMRTYVVLTATQRALHLESKGALRESEVSHGNSKRRKRGRKGTAARNGGTR